MKSALRYLLIGLALVILAALALSWSLRGQAAAQAADRAADRLQRVSVVATDVRDDALQQLQLRAAALASDPAFVDYVVQSLQPGAAANGGIDRASVIDLLKTRRSGYEMSAVLDAQGKPVAVDGALPGSAASVQNDALVTHTIATQKPSAGAWVHQGKLWWVTINPLRRGGIAQGLLLTAARVDNGYAATVSRHTGTAVAVLVAKEQGYTLVSSHDLPAWAPTALPELAAGRPTPDALPLPDSELKLPSGGLDEIGRIMPVATSNGRAVLIALAKPVNAPADFAWPVVLLAVFGALAVLWHWWYVQRPLQHLADRVSSASRGRRPPQFAEHGGMGVRRLARHLNRLFERKHDD